jgi:hypothetical protein
VGGLSILLAAVRPIPVLKLTTAMALIRLAISIFALTLIGLAFSLNAAQSSQKGHVSDATIASRH